jgi:hypothetical protein
MCIIIYASRPQNSMLKKIAVSGIPVALWPRARCLGPDHDLCDRRRLTDDLRPQIEKTSFDDLPGRVRKLRLEALTKKPEPHCGRRLTLLWDDPDRIPDPPTYMDE